MVKYKVIFENNKPVAANKMELPNQDCVRIEYPGGRSMIMWLVVYANSKQESLDVASTIIKGIFPCENGLEALQGTIPPQHGEIAA